MDTPTVNMQRGKKRKTGEAVITTSIESVDLPDGWMEKLLDLGPDSLAHVLGSLAQTANITASQIKKVRIGLPSFSGARWIELAPKFNLPVDLTMFQFESFTINPVLLPPSFHESTAKGAWHILDVYQEQISQDRKEVRVRVFDAYLIPIVGLFQGRIIDKPEHSMASTAYSSGGEVEHELFMIGGILFFVIEMKLGCEGQDNIAQLFLELLSAAEMNKNAKFKNLRVHGLLTDLQAFHFYSYDPRHMKFYFDETIQANPARELFIADMTRVTNKVFSIILFAYIEGLYVSVEVSRARPPESPTGSSPAQQLIRSHKTSQTSGLQTRSGPRKSTEHWELGLTFAKDCLSKFGEPVSNLEDIEKRSSEAIELLTKSVHCIPRVSHYSGKADPATEAELRALTRRIVHAEYNTVLAQHIDAQDE